MRVVTWANGAGFAVALIVAVLAARRPVPPAAPPPAAAPSVTDYRVPLPGGGHGVRDASGEIVPIRPYRRIASGNALIDRLLLALCEADRVLAFSVYGARGPYAHQYAGKPTVDSFGPLEPIIALKPDLFVTNSFGASGATRKLRAAGVAVIDLGEMRGMATLVPTVRRLSTLLGAPERGERLLGGLTRRMRAIAAPLGDRPRRRALYLWGSGGHVFGATAGTSMHDVLVAAGLDDVAAARLKDWPQYSTEQLLAMAPEVIVTKEGAARTLCQQPAMERLEACQRHSFIELPGYLVDEPGPGMVDAAELLFVLAYPELARPGP